MANTTTKGRTDQKSDLKQDDSFRDREDIGGARADQTMRGEQHWRGYGAGSNMPAERDAGDRSFANQSSPGRYTGGSDGGAQDLWGRGLRDAHSLEDSHRGKGPAGFQRSDERIREHIHEILTDHDHIDASHIAVKVESGEVTLTGEVADRVSKRLAEDVILGLSGVKDVINQLRTTAR